MDDSDNDAKLQTREDSIDEDDAFSSLPPGSIKPSESSSTKKRKRSCGTKVNILFACYHHTMLPSCKYCLLLRKFQNVSTFTYLRSARATHANTMKENTIIVHNATLSHTRHPNAHKKEKELKEKKMKKTMSALKGKGVSNLLLRNNVCQIYLK